MRDSAVSYVRRGWYVFPLLPRQKEPFPGTHGWRDATDDERAVHATWTAYPLANIGIATEPSGLLVLDFDWRNGGEMAWQEWGKDIETARVKTPNGYHLYFTARPFRSHNTVAQGVDVKSKGYVLAPPSIHPSGEPYRWDNQLDPIELPGWLYDACRKPDYTPREVVGDEGHDDTRPGSIFNRRAEWEDIFTPAGWREVYSDADWQHWCRPGKTTGVSGSTSRHTGDGAYGGLSIFYPFTTSTEFDANTSYTKFAVHTILNYGGDYSAAASDLAALYNNSLFRRPPPEERRDVDYAFQHAFPPEHFVSRYIDYAGRQTDAPTEYHEVAALTVLAALTPAARGLLAPFPGGLRTNLYAILVGPTTVSRKSTAQGIAANLLKSISYFSRLPDRETPEGFIETLSERRDTGTLWTPDELGISIADMYRRDFMNTLEGLLLTLYAGDDYTYHRSGGGPGITIRQPHLSILGAATPESLSRAGSMALESGLLPRFAVVYPKVMPEPRPTQAADPDIPDVLRSLERTLRDVESYSRIGSQVTFSNTALGLLNASESTLVGGGSHTARLPTMLYKVAMLSALADCRSEVNDRDASAADRVVRRWVEGVNNLRTVIYRKAADVEFENQVQHAFSVLAEKGGAAHRSEIALALMIPKSALDRIESTLQDRAMIRVDITDAGRVWNATH